MKFVLPIAIVLPRKTRKDKRVILNLNNYPSWSFFLYADLKRRYREALAPQLVGQKVATPCRLRFTLHRKDKRSGDRQNVLAVQEKFFCDAMTHYGCWPDDTDEYILSTEYVTGDIDRENPRVEVEITPV
jgi:Holliday junction resolvase RusA-like endonuclease